MKTNTQCKYFKWKWPNQVLICTILPLKSKLVGLGKIGSQSPSTHIAQVNAFIVLRIKFLFFEVFFCSFLPSANDARWMKGYNSHWRLEFKFDKIIHSSILFLLRPMATSSDRHFKNIIFNILKMTSSKDFHFQNNNINGKRLTKKDPK
jgi:hypothetical protein